MPTIVVIVLSIVLVGAYATVTNNAPIVYQKKNIYGEHILSAVVVSLTLLSSSPCYSHTKYR